MPQAYIVVAVFVILSLFEPLSMLAFSILARRRSVPNQVKNNNYESGEGSRGSRTSTMNEYLYYFPLFILFEIITVVALVWAINAKALGGAYGTAMLILFGAGIVLEFLALLTVKYERYY